MHLKAMSRMIPTTSRGGALVVNDLKACNFKIDNVYLRILPDIVKAAKKNSVVISLGATYRSGTIFDTFDESQQLEIQKQLELAKTITNQGVGVVIETPGHAKLSDIDKICHSFSENEYVVMPLGPIPTDSAINMDHISGCIGASFMGYFGFADILSVVTSKEHTGGIPECQDIINSIKAYNVVAHIIDIDKINDTQQDYEVAQIRAHKKSCNINSNSEGCKRCGDRCPLIT